MEYQEARDYIEQIRKRTGSEYSLRSVDALRRKMGCPESGQTVIHLAGTNGKGSVGAYLAAGLAAMGYTVGRFASPCVRHYRDQFQRIGAGNTCGMGESVSQEEYAAALTQIRQVLDAWDETQMPLPTAFEIETILSWCLFAKWQVDFSIVECGMGGALDATNCLPQSAVTVLCSVGLDHCGFLGESLEEITRSKAGIFRDGTPIVSQHQLPEVEKTLQEICGQGAYNLTMTEPVVPEQCHIDQRKMFYQYHGMTFCLRQPVYYQAANACLAWRVLEVLAGQGRLSSPTQKTANAFSEVCWPGRFQILSQSPLVILDGAHNPQGAQALASGLEKCVDKGSCRIMMGVFADKDYPGILEQIVPYAREFCAVRAPGVRGLPAEKLADAVRDVCRRGNAAVSQVQVETGTIADTLQRWITNGDQSPVIICGSLSFQREVWDFFDTRQSI